MLLLLSMIYLIITTCITNRYGILNHEQRKDRYIYSITETLKHLPSTIIPIIVENNGKRETYLDNFYHNEKLIDVIYTTNNIYTFKNKAINELFDIKDVISQVGIKDVDIIIKLTGRYRVTSPNFFNKIIENEEIKEIKEINKQINKKHDAFLKFYNVCTYEFNQNDCILGLYAIRAQYIQLLNHFVLEKYTSPEVAFAKFVRLNGIHCKEMDDLNVECIFSDSNIILYV